MIRVLHYVGMMNRGGMETLIMNLYRNIDRNQIQFDFAVHTVEKADFDDEILNYGGRIFRFPPYRENPRRYKKKWQEFWTSHYGEFRAIHIHTNSLANIVALKTAYKAMIPIRIVHSHSTWANKGKLQIINDFLHKRHQKKLPVYATDLVACSNDAAKWLFGAACEKKMKINLLDNGIKSDEFIFDSDTRNKKRKEMGIDSEVFLIGHVGKFVPVKNHTFLIDIIKELSERESLAKLILIGDGPLRNSIEEKVKKLNLEKNVSFLGVREDINELMMSIDAFVMPSLYEGFGIAALEAAAAGAPIYLSENMPKDFAFYPRCIYLSLDATPKEWANTIIEMSSSNFDRKNGSRMVKEVGYDIVDTVRKYVHILKNVEETK